MTKSTRNITVQTPGAVPNVQPETANPPAAAPAPAVPVASAPEQHPLPELPETPFKVVQATTKPELTEADVEAMRAQIREEERAIIQAELAQQIRAAHTVIQEAPAAATAAPHSKSDYRNMRAADIDPATLVAPVLTKDGYLCPPAPEAKK